VENHTKHMLWTMAYHMTAEERQALKSRIRERIDQHNRELNNLLEHCPNNIVEIALKRAEELKQLYRTLALLDGL